ncbi:MULTISPECIES: hypothetical protein [Bacteria]|jgi:hypothetical protein|uniref:Bacteriocin n=1 Tax=Stenotrophomonas forensis TaxID=2871169 RepID=A0ABY7Y1G3_9GAMM|nr:MULTISPECIES: hypothetical protein [Pseudomonadota]MBH1462702.1 hypothetical protein [Stenotrophomonas maltophilia]MBH1477991.1 hypothetical protein [Stenotrophomonas maltophilia]MBH1503583.1 hypothetical protein [Stenotrophomonas maltophilia]MBH1785789.1 hypothetical protein [Stenotrophomonas maltophilia]MBH1841570.1 hypothetical protein [Stenotrophomonas maltophilia]
MKNEDIKKDLESRVLGHILSQEEMEQVGGGDGDGIPTLPPVKTTPASDNGTTHPVLE